MSLGPLLDRISRHKRILLLLDFDGTLCEVKAKPEQAELSLRRRALLRSLSRSGVSLAVLSGRPVADLRQRVDLPDTIYGGNYGLDIRGPGLRFLHPSARASRGAVVALRKKLASRFRGLPGVLIEDKGTGLGLHYHNVPRSRLDDFMSRWGSIQTAGTPNGLRWEAGRDAWEARPDCRWGKGAAARLLWRRLGRPYPVAIGDAASDEEMFEALAGIGSTLHVGIGGSTKAQHRLADVSGTYDFLRRLNKMVAAGLKA